MCRSSNNQSVNQTKSNGSAPCNSEVTIAKQILLCAHTKKRGEKEMNEREKNQIDAFLYTLQNKFGMWKILMWYSFNKHTKRANTHSTKRTHISHKMFICRNCMDMHFLSPSLSLSRLLFAHICRFLYYFEYVVCVLSLSIRFGM